MNNENTRRTNLLLNLTELSAEPFHSQISRQLYERIIDGDLDGGAELESIRALARAEHVSLRTVEQAYKQLQREGLIESADGKVYSVSKLSPERKRTLVTQKRAGRRPVLRALETLSTDLVSLYDPGKIRAVIDEALRRELGVSELCFVLREGSGEKFVLLSDRISVPKLEATSDDALLRRLEHAATPQPVDEAPIDTPPSLIHRALSKRSIHLLVPLRDARQFLGFLGLSQKKGNCRFSGEEMDLLTILANLFVTALTAARLQGEILEKRRMQEELEVARHIQAGLLPKELPSRRGVALACHSQLSRAVGGDLYDCFDLDEHRLGVMIADACGSGLPAALLTSQVHAMLRSEIRTGQGPGAVLEHMNHQLYHFTPRDRFVTLFFGVLDRRSGRFEYANGGHNQPVLVRADGRCEWLRAHGPALGLTARATYPSAKIGLSPGDLMIMYTDGITEAMNPAKEEYGELRLADVAVRARRQPVQELLQLILADVGCFHDGAAVVDDRTLVLLKRSEIDTEHTGIGARKPGRYRHRHDRSRYHAS